MVAHDEHCVVIRGSVLRELGRFHGFRAVSEQVAKDEQLIETLLARSLQGIAKMIGGRVNVTEDCDLHGASSTRSLLQLELRGPPLPKIADRLKPYTSPPPVSSCGSGNADRKARVDTGKKVLIVGSFAPSLTRFRGPLITAMVEHGHTVVAAAPDIDQETGDALRKIGAHVREIPLRNVSLNPMALVRSLRAMRALIRQERPDVLISYTIKPVIVAALAGRAEKVGTIVSLITGAGYAFTGGRELKRLLSRAAASLLYRIALKRSDVIVFQNPDDERLFRDLGLVPRHRETFMVNGSGVDLAHFSPVPVPDGTSFLMIARLLKDKGIREFAEAAKRLKEVHPEIPITLVGDFDPSPDSLSREALDELVRCGIDYQGHVADVRPMIAACSVYVLPSYREGTPRSVLEAMAMGRAIITTDAPGCRETVRDGQNGFLVRPRDADSLYEAMIRFIDEPGLARKMGEESRRLAETKYDVAKVNAKLLRYAGLSC